MNLENWLRVIDEPVEVQDFKKIIDNLIESTEYTSN